VGELILAVVVGAILFAVIRRGSKNNRLAKKLDACVAGMQKALEAGDFGRFAELDAAAANIERESVWDIDRWGHVKNGDPYSCAWTSLNHIRKDYMAMPKRERYTVAQCLIDSINNKLADMRSCLAAGDLDRFKKLDEAIEMLGIGDARKYGMLNVFPSGLLSELERLRAEKRESEEERESITREYKELVETFLKLFSDGSSQWDELTRTSNALNGTSKSTPFRDAVEIYTTRIIKAFSVANGSTPNGLGRMFHMLTVTGREKDAYRGIPGNFARGLTMGQIAELGRSPHKPWTIAKCVEESIRWIDDFVDHTPPDVPNVVMALSAFDGLRKTHLAADTADAYYALVIRASECCSASMAVDALRAKYLTLLQPYISADSFKNGSQSSSGDRNDNESCIQFNGNCPKCVKYFPVLRLKPDAGEKETKEAYRNFVKIYHPDRFEGKSERQTAEEELKQINEAYRHIIEHFEAAASKAASAGVSQ
jgi:hypothetical protein